MLIQPTELAAAARRQRVRKTWYCAPRQQQGRVPKIAADRFAERSSEPAPVRQERQKLTVTVGTSGGPAPYSSSDSESDGGVSS